MLGTIIRGYREFENRVTHLVNGKMTKADRVRMVFEQRLGKVTKADIALECPDISISTIEQTLNKLLSEGFLEKVGRGKQTAYVKR